MDSTGSRSWSRPEARGLNYLKPILVAGYLLVAAPFAAPLAQAAPYDTAVLQGLDKVTARISKIVIAVGNTARFGTLDIIVHHCDKRPPEETPESAAFLDIAEIKPGEPAVTLFRGWMFSSSPAVSALEHPVYDIWVLDCITAQSPSD